MKTFQVADLIRLFFVERACQSLAALLATTVLFVPHAQAEKSGWSMGFYAGKYYDSEPAGILQGRANFMDQHMLALTASKTVWRSESLPMSLEIDGMVGQQFGIDALTEIAVAPVLRWSSFPWNNVLQTDLRLAPLGLSYTSKVSSLELGTEGKGSRMLNLLLIELAFSRPQHKSGEVFVRLHHRCAVYDLLNNYGANGEDFLAFGYRHRF
jgi:hypothetical protein